MVDPTGPSWMDSVERAEPRGPFRGADPRCRAEGLEWAESWEPICGPCGALTSAVVNSETDCAVGSFVFWLGRGLGRKRPTERAERKGGIQWADLNGSMQGGRSKEADPRRPIQGGRSKEADPRVLTTKRAGRKKPIQGGRSEQA